MKNSRWPVAATISGIALVTGLVVLSFWGAPAQSTHQEKKTGITAVDKTAAPSTELKNLLDASRAPQDACLTLVKSHGIAVVNDTYTLRVEPSLRAGLVNAVSLGDVSALQWSDALDLPLAGTTPAEKMVSAQIAVCTKPLVGESLANLFAHLKIGGTSVLSMQGTNWLEYANVSTAQINDLVAKDVPLLYGKDKGKTTDKDYTDAAKAARKYQVMASKLITLLSRYQLGPIASLDSTSSYHLVKGGVVADKVPEVEITNEPDTRQAVTLYLTEKTNCKPLSVLGFNTGDARPELGNIPDSCVTLTPGCTTDCSSSTPKCTNNCGGTPGCTSNCTPVCHVNCLTPKNPSKDVGANTRVDPFLQDGGEKHVVSNEDGAKVANGNQGTAADVIAAQQAAAAKAAADAAAAKAAHDAAVKAAEESGGGQVSTNQDQGSSGSPNW